MNIRIIYMIIRSIKLVHKVNVFACKIIISSRLWRVGYRQVVLGRRKHFGCPKTQLANFINLIDFLSFTSCIYLILHPIRYKIYTKTMELYPIRCKMKNFHFFAVNCKYKRHLGRENKRFYFALRSVCTIFAPR